MNWPKLLVLFWERMRMCRPCSSSEREVPPSLTNSSCSVAPTAPFVSPAVLLRAIRVTRARPTPHPLTTCAANRMATFSLGTDLGERHLPGLIERLRLLPQPLLPFGHGGDSSLERLVLLTCINASLAGSLLLRLLLLLLLVEWLLLVERLLRLLPEAASVALSAAGVGCSTSDGGRRAAPAKVTQGQ